jgi:hypothetical protein
MSQTTSKESKSTKTIKNGLMLIGIGAALFVLNSPSILERIASLNAPRLAYLFVFLPILLFKRNYLTHEYRVRVIFEDGCPAVGKIIEKRPLIHDKFNNHWVQRRATDKMGLCLFESQWRIGLRKKRKPERTFVVQNIEAVENQMGEVVEVKEKDFIPGQVATLTLVIKKANLLG